MESFIFLYEKCRLCLEQPGSISIYGSETKDLPEEILLCTGLKVHPKDNLPQKICNQCLQIIQNAKQLRDRALKNNTHLRSLFDIDGVDHMKNLTQCSQEEDITSSDITKSSENKEYVNNERSIEKNKAGPSINISVRKDLFELSSTVTSSSSKRISESNTEEFLDDVHSCKKIRVDENTVLYECPICFKTYDTWKKLYLHHRLHKKTAVCPVETCGKKFSTKGDLEKHVRTHTGEKPFKCDECDRSFSQRVTLKVHRERVHCVLLT